ncbi:hypothetical protein R3P38DRAFT_2803750 [Favolaschia claudopus]|uniref:PWWP domain-containing protein n=1 Tax=Favolaschia claudopus TaxID=2862362 RepID=A0AAV9ZRL9_9AGAR
MKVKKSRNGVKSLKSARSPNEVFSVGNVVLAKVRGFRKWPAMVVDQKSLPETVLNVLCSILPSFKLVRRVLTPSLHLCPSSRSAWCSPENLESFSVIKISKIFNSGRKIQKDFKEGLEIAAQLLMGTGKSLETLGRGANMGEDRKPKTDGAESLKMKVEVNEDFVDGIEEMGRRWRRDLQKTFFPADKSQIKSEMMPAMDELFGTIEDRIDISFKMLCSCKIGKIMRYIHALPVGEIPCHSDFRFRERAVELVEKWKLVVLAQSSTAGTLAW